MKLILESEISLISFLFGFLILIIFSFYDVFTLNGACFVSLFIFSCLLLYYITFSRHNFQIALRSYFLGLTFSFGALLFIYGSSLSLAGLYLSILAFFHWSEYFFTSISNPQNLNLDSFLLNHSLEYHLAIVASLIEFLFEWYFFPGLSVFNWPSYLGLSLVIGGEFLRKYAMVNAGTNFSHLIKNKKNPGHLLVTHGLYAYVRHPAYVGWFYWSVGTQILMLNPICAVLYSLMSWYFFKERIYTEEYTLLCFFDEEYARYQKTVPTGIPFVEGCVFPPCVS